jgi:hypothetical protein
MTRFFFVHSVISSQSCGTGCENQKLSLRTSDKYVEAERVCIRLSRESQMIEPEKVFDGTQEGVVIVWRCDHGSWAHELRQNYGADTATTRPCNSGHWGVGSREFIAARCCIRIGAAELGFIEQNQEQSALLVSGRSQDLRDPLA